MNHSGAVDRPIVIIHRRHGFLGRVPTNCKWLSIKS